MNQWNEPDEFPVIGKYHVRHSITAAKDTGYLFGKNFETLADALSFCNKTDTYPQSRLLIHIENEVWLRIDYEHLKLRYYTPGIKDLRND